MNELIGYFEFWNLGRERVRFKSVIRGNEHFFETVGRHLMSEDISYQYDHEKNEGQVLVGFFRPVGKFRRVE